LIGKLKLKVEGESIGVASHGLHQCAGTYEVKIRQSSIQQNGHTANPRYLGTNFCYCCRCRFVHSGQSCDEAFDLASGLTRELTQKLNVAILAPDTAAPTAPQRPAPARQQSAHKKLAILICMRAAVRNRTHRIRAADSFRAHSARM
jgi:hypothetical protein